MFAEKDEVTHEEYGHGKVTKIFANGADTIYGVDFGMEYNLFVSARDLSARENV